MGSIHLENLLLVMHSTLADPFQEGSPTHEAAWFLRVEPASGPQQVEPPRMPDGCECVLPRHQPAIHQHSPRHVGKFPVIGLWTVLSALCLAIKYAHLIVSKELPGLPAITRSPQPLLPGLTPCLVNLI